MRREGIRSFWRFKFSRGEPVSRPSAAHIRVHILARPVAPEPPSLVSSKPSSLMSRLFVRHPTNRSSCRAHRRALGTLEASYNVVCPGGLSSPARS